MTAPAAVETPAAVIPAAATPERPTWLPEKFKTPEEMATAYKELETKQSTAAPAVPVVEVVKQAGVDIAKLGAEYAENGKLSAESLTDLAAKGIPQATVDAYIAGLNAVATQQVAKLQEVVGGKENLTKILEWAKTGLSPTEANAYDKALDANDLTSASMLLQNIQAKYTAAVGNDPKLVKGEIVPNAAGVQPFANTDQVHLAMRDPRYKTDPEYRAQVAKRLAIS